MNKISELFDIYYGNSLELNKLDNTDLTDKTGINFVSRTAKNNGVSARVKKIAGIEPFEEGLITVALGGTVLETFIQPYPFYTGYHVMVLKPKKPMTYQEKLFFVMCIKKNKYRYNYGRQANRTLKDILIPTEIPEWVYAAKLNSFDKYAGKVTEQIIPLNLTEWKSFLYTDLFEIKKGKRVTKLDMKKGATPFIAAMDSNNGYREFCDLPPMFNGNVITVSYNGSVGEAFYQPKPFWASDDINVLIPKFELNPFIAMFIITVIRKDKYRFNYGRKWHKERMEKSILNLPAKIDGTPDWDYMENYIKSLPYSNSL